MLPDSLLVVLEQYHRPSASPVQCIVVVTLQKGATSCLLLSMVLELMSNELLGLLVEHRDHVVVCSVSCTCP